MPKIKKLNKRQINLIAMLWAGNQLKNVGTDSFDADFPHDQEVVEKVKALGQAITTGHPEFYRLQDIIEYATNLKL